MADSQANRSGVFELTLVTGEGKLLMHTRGARWKLRVAAACFFLVILLGCSVHAPRPVDMTGMDAVRPGAVLESEKPTAAPGPPPFVEKMEPLAQGLDLPPQIYAGVFNAAPFGDVLQTLVQDSHLSLSVESEVDLNRPVTVQLQQASLSEALDMVVVQGAGYAWNITGDTLAIKQFEERIYYFDYLDMSDETDIEIGGDMLASSVEESGVAGKYTIKARRATEITDVWTSIAAVLDGFRSENGVVHINRNAGVIYMADFPRRVAAMVQFLDAIIEALQRQVFIEAKILEVSLSDQYRYGIDWTKMEIAFVDEGNDFPDNFSLSINSGSSVMKAGQSGFAAILDYLQTQGDVSVVSNPHLAVMNGKSAILTVGFQFPFADIDGVDRDAETGVITFGTSIKRAVLGLQLGITPHISRDGIVTLNIIPTITRIQGEQRVDIPTTATATQSISNPVIDLQELSTTVRIREGNSIVLAGLISQMRQATHEGLPLLSRIPLLKYFFKHMEQTNQNRELVIFITPYVRNAM